MRVEEIRRRVLGLLGVATIVIVALSALVTPATAVPGVSSRIVQTADLSAFRAGNIVSDSVFYDSSRMSESQIQAFLESRVSSCRSGYTCLKDYYDTTRSVPADAVCGAYAGGERERASRIIYKAALACGINPQVLLVFLQKEQGLVTSTAPSSWAYRAAMGQGCPDTSACDSRYYGLFNQVFGAAWQLKRYSNPPGTSNYFTWYAPGRTWNIYWHSPELIGSEWVYRCGSGPVYIENQATAALYYYTPYQPNAAALAAGYGEGDACSSYGNRNFFNYFSDWFGSPTLEVSGSIADAWREQGGASGWIGAPTAAMVWNADNNGGWYQTFANATIYVTRGGPTVILKTPSLIRMTYVAQGGPSGVMGWPSAGETCGAFGCSVGFQGGTMIWSNQTDKVGRTVGAINAYWLAGGGVNNPLRAPASVEQFDAGSGGGWYQNFLGGTVFVKRGGATTSFAAASSLLHTYLDLDGPSSGLGWPSASEECGAIGCLIDFDGGVLTWDSRNGAIHRIVGDLELTWFERGGAGNWIGAAQGDMVTVSGGWTQDFANGSYYLKAGGVVVELKSASALHDRYRQGGATKSALGWPTQVETCGANGCIVRFENGYLSWDSRSGAIAALSGAIAAAWADTGEASSWYGAPQDEAQRVSANGGGVSQQFGGGIVYAKDGEGAVFHKRSSALAAQYRSLGGPNGDLGWPTEEEQCGDGKCWLQFERGELVWYSSTGTIVRR